jgi:hypothetical protein
MVTLFGDDTSERARDWFVLHGVVCLTGGGALALYCFDMYRTGVTPDLRGRNLAGGIAWTVVAAVGAIIFLGGYLLQPLGAAESEPQIPPSRGSRVFNWLVAAEALIAALVSGVAALMSPVLPGCALVLVVPVIGWSLIINFFFLLLGVT